jgi:hypothetical protein
MRKQMISPGFWMLMHDKPNKGRNFELQTITFCKQTAYSTEEMTIELSNRDWENIGYCLRQQAGWEGADNLDQEKRLKEW